MSEWIKELEVKSKDENREYTKGNLRWFHPYVVYSIDANFSGEDYVTLDGDFTIDQLQDLVNHMKRYKGE